MIRSIPALTLLLAAGAPALAQGDADGRVFGRVGPERPVVEIPAEQRSGVTPSAPPQGWDVHDPSRVTAVEAIPPEPAGPDAAADPALAAALQPATVADQPATPVVEADQVVPYTPPVATAEPRRLGAAAPAGEPLGESGAQAEKPWWQEMGQTLAALGIVLALIMALAFVYTRLSRSSGSLMAPATAGRSPAGLLEVLARYPVGPRQALMLLKFDRRVLLVTQTTPRGGPVQMTTLCELTDPEDVASVLVKVRDGSGGSMNDAFRTAMSRAGAAAPVAPASAGSPAPEFMPAPASYAEPKPAFETDYDPEDLRRTVGGSEEERAQLWEDIGTTPAGRDPIGTLRRRLHSMRGGQAG